jgi:Family of unknown function (DUF5996)
MSTTGGEEKHGWGRASADASENLPELRFAEWRDTKATLHLYLQILGKVRMQLAPPRNHWWHVTLYMDTRGLTTRRLRHRGTTFDIRLDFVDHALVVSTDDGRMEGFPLMNGLSVARFDDELHRTLRELGLDVDIRERPFGLPIKTPFPDDIEHRSWDGDAVGRFWRILDWSGGVFEEFSGWFCGKASPVHLFWHSLDLAVTRFSGRRAPVDADDPVEREAYSHEAISFGLWPGDDNIDYPAYYSYTAPEPDGLRDQVLPAGSWIESGSGSLAILPYEQVRTARDPRGTLLAFCQGAYESGATLAGWDIADLRSSWCPNPSQLSALKTVAAATPSV